MNTHKIGADAPLHVVADLLGRHLLVGQSGSLRLYPGQDTRQQPHYIASIEHMHSMDYYSTNGKVVVTGGDDQCCLHDLGLVVNHNGEVRDLTPMRVVFKSSSKVMDAVFVNEDRVLVGDMGAKLSLFDIKDAGEGGKLGEWSVDGEIVGLSFNAKKSLICVTVADGQCFIYRYNHAESSITKLASLGDLFVDKRLSLAEGFDDDSDDDDIDSDEDSFITDTTENTNVMADEKVSKKLLNLTATRGEWSLDGTMLAIPTKKKKINLYHADQFETPFGTLDGGLDGAKGFFTNVAFSKDGSKLASLSLDKKLIFWNVSGFNVIGKENLKSIGSEIIWTSNTSLAIGSIKAELTTIDSRCLNVILDQMSQFQESEEPARKKISRDSDLFGDEDDIGDDVNMEDDDEDDAHLDLPQPGDDDGFIVGDNEDEPSYNKRYNNADRETSVKRVRFNQQKINQQHPQTILKPHSTGATPWVNQRRFLTICEIGTVESVVDESYNHVTVTYFDESDKRGYHFTDINHFDLCCMDQHGILFSTSGFKRKEPNFEFVLSYKKHSIIGNDITWSRKLKLGPGEFVTTISTSESHSFVGTSLGVVRKFTNYGRLIDMWVCDPMVACINNDKYLFSVILKGGSTYWFNIQDINGRYLHQNLSLPMQELKTLIWSKDGNPCIFRNEDDLMMVLTDWRSSKSSPIWKPLLDIKYGVQSKGKGSDLKAWPLALNDDEFVFIPYKGSKYPSAGLLAPMVVDVSVPYTYKEGKKEKTEDSDDLNSGEEEANESEDDEDTNFEQAYLKYKTLYDSLFDGVNNGDIRDDSYEEKLTNYDTNIKKSLIMMLSSAIEEANSEDAFDICMLMDKSLLPTAKRLADKYDMVDLSQQISRLIQADDEY